MESSALTMFMEKYSNDIAGVINCFDRFIIRGTLPPIAHEQVINAYLRQNKILVKDYTKFAMEKRDIIIKHMDTFAQANNIPVIQVDTPTAFKKEAEIQKLISTNKIISGYVAILKVTESCRVFRHGKDSKSQKICLQQRSGKCLHYYIYFIDQTLGLCFVRIQTYLPCDMQIYFNGHNYLAGKLLKHDIPFKMIDNAFVYIDDYKKAQEFVDAFKADRLKKILDAFAGRFVPFLEPNQWSYRWTMMQVEYATDIIFKKPEKVEMVYQELSHKSILSIKPKDIASFFETRYSSRTTQTVVNRIDDRSIIAQETSVTRVKHQKGANAIEMYNKGPLVIRVETTINNPHELFTFRTVNHRNGSSSKKRAYLKKCQKPSYSTTQIVI